MIRNIFLLTYFTFCSANIHQLTGEDPYGNVISKKLRSTSSWVLYCKFAADLQSTFLEEDLWGTACVFYVICFSASNKQHILQSSFYNLQTKTCRLIKIFLTLFLILWYIFRNNFLIACYNWGTYYIFISIFSQTSVCRNCRSIPPQVLIKKDHLIYACYEY